MTADELLASARAGARDGTPPGGLTPLLHSMWLEARGDWEGAHQIAQDDDSRDAAWVHAYLHRKEGDVGNAAYWYGCAGRPEGRGGLEEEWRTIVGVLAAGRPSRSP